MEIYEDDIEDWYFKRQGDISLTTYLCSQRALKNKDDSCLDEIIPQPSKKKKSKGEKKNDEL